MVPQQQLNLLTSTFYENYFWFCGISGAVVVFVAIITTGCQSDIRQDDSA
jgi:hypothetical protein